MYRLLFIVTLLLCGAAMYANGKGVPKDNVLAYLWLNLAGTQGSEDAKEWYARIAKEMITE